GVRVPSPVHVDLGKVRVVAPVALVDEGENAGAVSAEWRAENAVACRLGRVLGGKPLPLELHALVEDVPTDRVGLDRLVKIRNGTERDVQQADQVRKRDAEEPRNATDDVHPRPAELRERDHVEADEGTAL